MHCSPEMALVSCSSFKWNPPIEFRQSKKLLVPAWAIFDYTLRTPHDPLLGRIQDLVKGDSDKYPPKEDHPRGVQGHAPPAKV